MHQAPRSRLAARSQPPVAILPLPCPQDAQAPKYTTAMVYSPRKDTFCVLRAADRPAECLLKCSGDCQTKKDIHCP